MAEAIARRLLDAEAGHEVASAGLHALDGAAATREVDAVLAEIGLDAGHHVARSLTPGMVAAADRIYVMTGRQRRELGLRHPEAAAKVELLDPSGAEVADPYARSTAAYRRCRDHIRAAVDDRVAEWRGDDPVRC
jgi:protein-tyrosine-phosphatase